MTIASMRLFVLAQGWDGKKKLMDLSEQRLRTLESGIARDDPADRQQRKPADGTLQEGSKSEASTSYAGGYVFVLRLVCRVRDPPPFAAPPLYFPQLPAGILEQTVCVIVG